MRIVVGREGLALRRQARVAAVWSFTNFATYLVTCAHVFRGGLTTVYAPDLARVVGRLRVNMLHGPVKRDIAIVELSHGVVVDPGAVNAPIGSIAKGSVCTWTRGDVLRTVLIDEIDAANDYLKAGGGFIRVGLGEVLRSDSGAPLIAAANGHVVGLLTGKDMTHSFFTPLAGVTHLPAIQALP